MPQTELISTRSHPKVMYAFAVFFLIAALVSKIVFDQMSWAHADLVKWRTLEEGEKEAVRVHKPVLYLFTADWCAPCRKMKSEYFANATNAEMINKTYVPIKIVDRKMEDGKNPEPVDKLMERHYIGSFPTLLVVAPDLIGSGHDDVFSTDNTAKSLIRYSGRQYLPQCTGYGGKTALNQYFKSMEMWNKMQGTRGRVNWLPSEKVWQPPVEKGKQRLIVVLENHQADSNEARMHLLNGEKGAEFLNKNFDCYLLEYARVGSTKTQALADEARAKFKLKVCPAFILLDRGEREPAVYTGYSSITSVVDFLERATDGRAKPPVWD
jgi:thiol-disulfide isomerase/thioredoxin